MIEEKDDNVEDKQTAVVNDTDDGSSKSTSEDGDAAQDDGDGLDALLAEFEERQDSKPFTEKKEEVTAAAEKSDTKGNASQIDVGALAALEERLNQQEAREQRRSLENLFSEIADGTNGDEVDAEAYLNAVAARNPKLIDVYNERAIRPDRWKKAQREIKRDFDKRYGKKVDQRATEGRDAVTSAVRSAQTAAPDNGISEQDVVNASQDEWAAMQRKLGVTPV